MYKLFLVRFRYRHFFVSVNSAPG